MSRQFAVLLGQRVNSLLIFFFFFLVLLKGKFKVYCNFDQCVFLVSNIDGLIINNNLGLLWSQRVARDCSFWSGERLWSCSVGLIQRRLCTRFMRNAVDAPSRTTHDSPGKESAYSLLALSTLSFYERTKMAPLTFRKPL